VHREQQAATLEAERGHLGGPNGRYVPPVQRQRPQRRFGGRYVRERHHGIKNPLNIRDFSID
jgi:hypothetical protein